MKSMLVIGAFIVAAAVTAVPAAVLHAQGDKALEDAAAARSKAMSSGDADGWGKYTTDDFIVVEADGTMKTKAQRLTEIKAAPTPASPPTDVKVRTYGCSRTACGRRPPFSSRPSWPSSFPAPLASALPDYFRWAWRGRSVIRTDAAEAGRVKR